jgi:hypothetical protein
VSGRGGGPGSPGARSVSCRPSPPMPYPSRRPRSRAPRPGGMPIRSALSAAPSPVCGALADQVVDTDCGGQGRAPGRTLTPPHCTMTSTAPVPASIPSRDGATVNVGNPAASRRRGHGRYRRRPGVKALSFPCGKLGVDGAHLVAASVRGVRVWPSDLGLRQLAPATAHHRSNLRWVPVTTFGYSHRTHNLPFA